MLHMKQKHYILEVVESLLGGQRHVREIARELDTNPMMVSRKLDELVTMNVADFKRLGRNKVYFLRDTPESRAFVMMAEQYRLVKCIEKYPYLRDIIMRLQSDGRIRLAVIFGSHAKGLVRKNSDIDIFIETLDRKIKKNYSGLDSRLSIKIGNLGKDELSREIAKNYVIIKGGELYHEKREKVFS